MKEIIMKTEVVCHNGYVCSRLDIDRRLGWDHGD